MMLTPGYGLSTHRSRRDLRLSFLNNIPSGITYTRNDSVATIRNEVGKLVAVAANVARIDHDTAGNSLGLLIEGSVQNKCTNTNCNPSTTTNMTKSGDAAAILSVVDDSTALAAGLLDALCTNGKVYKLDNTAGSTTAVVDIGGTTGNINPHTFSVWARCSTSNTGGTLTRNGTGGNVVNITGTAYARYVLANETPSGTTVGFRIRANANRVVYFILNQMEEMPFATSEIVTAGAAATRAADRVTMVVSKKPWFSESAGYMAARYRIKGFIPSVYQYILVADNGSNSNDTIGFRNNHTDYDLSAYIRAGAVSQNSYSNDDTHIAGALNAGGITWKAGESTLLSGGKTLVKTYAADASGITTLNIGARTGGADPFFGHITSLVLGKGYKSMQALGGLLHDGNDVVVIGGGQSLLRGYFQSQETSGESGKQMFRQTLGLALPRKVVHFIDGATGGSAASSTSDGSNYWWDLASGARGSAFTTFYSNIAAAGIVPSVVLFELGETESGAIKTGSTTRAQYKSAMQAIFSDIRANLGNVSIVLQKVGHRTGFEYDGAVQTVRSVQDELVNELSYVVRGAETYDMTLYDTVHPNDAGYLVLAARNARVIGNLFGAGFIGVNGPSIASYSRSGTSVTVNLTHDAGTDFTPTSNIAGFHYFGGTTEVTINAAIRTNATTVTLTLATMPTGTEQLYYIYDEEASLTLANVLKDNASVSMPLKTYGL